jgi:hypothetical protein
LQHLGDLGAARVSLRFTARSTTFVSRRMGLPHDYEGVAISPPFKACGNSANPLDMAGMGQSTSPISQCASLCALWEENCPRFFNSILIGEKLLTFVTASEQDSDFAAELPPFVTAIRRLFVPGEIREYLDHLEQMKFWLRPSRR